MAIDNERGPLPPWLEPENDSIPPEALRNIYQQLPIEVTQTCERARALQAQMLVALGRLQTGYLQASGEINGTQRVGVLAGPDGAIQVRG